MTAESADNGLTDTVPEHTSRRSVNLKTIRQLQEVVIEDGKGWRAVQMPFDGFRLRMNLAYIRRIGFDVAREPPIGIVTGYGYEGAICLRNGTVYLYR